MLNQQNSVIGQLSKCLIFIFIFPLFACQESDTSSGEVLVIDPITVDMNIASEEMMDSELARDSEINEQEQVQLTIQALNPLSSQGVAELEADLFLEGQSTEMPILTDPNGQAIFQVSSSSSYEVRLQSTGYSTHHLYGELGDNNAKQISFVSNDSLTNQVFSALNISPDPSKGIVVIGLDRPNLSPAVGSKAELNGAYELAFTLGSFGPSMGQEVVAGGGGFVSFANVEPGMLEVMVEPAPGETCRLFPKNQSESFTIPVYAGEVSIVAYTCQATE